MADFCFNYNYVHCNLYQRLASLRFNNTVRRVTEPLSMYDIFGVCKNDDIYTCYSTKD